MCLGEARGERPVGDQEEETGGLSCLLTQAPLSALDWKAYIDSWDFRGKSFPSCFKFLEIRFGPVSLFKEKVLAGRSCLTCTHAHTHVCTHTLEWGM